MVIRDKYAKGITRARGSATYTINRIIYRAWNVSLWVLNIGIVQVITRPPGILEWKVRRRAIVELYRRALRILFPYACPSIPVYLEAW